MPNSHTHKTYRFIQDGMMSRPFFDLVERDRAAETALLSSPSAPVELVESTDVLTPRVNRSSLWTYRPDSAAPTRAEFADPEPDAIGVPDPEIIVTR